MIYLDNSATSPIDEEVLDAMLPYLKEEYGNPSSKYYCKAKKAKNAVEEAREQVAKLLGAKFEEIIFTAGSTESTNFILKGYLDYRKHYVDGKNHVITSVVEHKATLNTCKYLNGEIYSNNDPTISLSGISRKVDRGYSASFVPVSETGEVMVDSVKAAIRPETAIASIIHVNNEVGTINDIGTISKMCHGQNIVVHSDITQSLGKIPLDVKAMGIDYASCSAHKLYGPKGVGAAYLMSDDYGIAPITAFMHGGEQEFGFRAGTLAVHNDGQVPLHPRYEAAEIARRELKAANKRILELDSYLIQRLETMDNVKLTNPSNKRIPGLISIIIDAPYFHNERFIKAVSDQLALSTGSACSAGEPSYVIRAMGLEDLVSKVLRITINKHTTKEELDYLIKTIKENV